MLRNLLWLPSICWRTALLPLKWGGALGTAPLSTPQPHVPASRQKGHPPRGPHPTCVQWPLGRPPKKWSPRSRAQSFPGGGRGVSLGAREASCCEGPQRAAESDKLESEGELCPCPLQARRLWEPPRAEGASSGPARQSLAGGPGVPPAPHLPVRSGYTVLAQQHPRPPARAFRTRASPPSLSHAASPRLRRRPHPSPLSGLSRAAQSLLPAPNLHPAGAPGAPFHRHRLGGAAWPGVSVPARPREGPPRPAPEAWPCAGEGGGDVVRGQRLQGCWGAGEMLVRKPRVWGAAGRSRQGFSHWGGSWGVPPNRLSPKNLSPHVSLSCKQLKCCCLLRPREVSGPHDTHFGL